MYRNVCNFLLVTYLGLALSANAAGDEVAGISRTDGLPLETGPFDSRATASGEEITYDFQPVYLTAEPNDWIKTFRWDIPANTGLAPGSRLQVTESLPFLYPDSTAGTDHFLRLPISDWHETIVGGELSDFFRWDSQATNTGITATIGNEEVPIGGSVSFSIDGKSIWFDFDPISIPAQGASSSDPLILVIAKTIEWVGPVLDPLPTSHDIELGVSEYPSTPGPIGDYNFDGVVDTADYVLWRGSDGTQFSYEAWRFHFGDALSQPATRPAMIPEPSTIILCLILGVGSYLIPHRRMI